MKVVHIISGLDNGGAEGVLLRLTREAKKRQIRSVIISLTHTQHHIRAFEDLGVNIYVVDFRNIRKIFSAILDFARIIRFEKPHVIQTWMLHAGVIAGLLCWLIGYRNIIWNVRHTRLDKTRTKKSLRILELVSVPLARMLPKKIICCADDVRDQYVKFGYPLSRCVVVNNGFDDAFFYYDGYRRDSTLNSKFKVGMVGRFDPCKNHAGMFSAISKMVRAGADCEFHFWGRGMNEQNSKILYYKNLYCFNNDIYFHGETHNMRDVYNDIDLLVLPSLFGEGFPNVLAESMLCGTPTISTNVGAANEIISAYGWILEEGSDEKIIEAIFTARKEKLHSPKMWEERGRKGRRSIQSKYGLDEMINRYVNIWKTFDPKEESNEI